MELSQNYALLLDVNNFIVKLDAYVSLLMGVIEFNLVPPEFNPESGEIYIKGARNLLVEYKRLRF